MLLSDKKMTRKLQYEMPLIFLFFIIAIGPLYIFENDMFKDSSTFTPEGTTN